MYRESTATEEMEGIVVPEEAKRRRLHNTPTPGPFACNEGWVSIGYMVVDPETGEEHEEVGVHLCPRDHGPEDAA